MSLAAFLAANDLSAFAQQFEDAGYDVDEIARLSDDDARCVALEEMGMPEDAAERFVSAHACAGEAVAEPPADHEDDATMLRAAGLPAVAVRAVATASGARTRDERRTNSVAGATFVVAKS